MTAVILAGVLDVKQMYLTTSSVILCFYDNFNFNLTYNIPTITNVVGDWIACMGL